MQCPCPAIQTHLSPKMAIACTTSLPAERFSSMLEVNNSDLLHVCIDQMKVCQQPNRKKLIVHKKVKTASLLDHLESEGRLLFEEVIKMDLEGIVCKRKDSPYKVTERPSRHWIKVKNARYSQLDGREELFEPR